MQSTQLDMFAASPPPSSSGKTSREFCLPQTTRLAASSHSYAGVLSHCMRPTAGQMRVVFLDPAAQPHGASWMPNFSAWPNDAAVCSLSQVLETGSIPQRFFLSGKACAGILRRAEARGKALPLPLMRALVACKDAADRTPTTGMGT